MITLRKTTRMMDFFLLSYETAKKYYSFTCEISFPLASEQEKKITMEFGE